ncbi:MAG TPA: hypothetical protein VJX95_03020, partial [Oscillospiraceae bacterium]|nr:hypothetical protein [Oscillospiraceae bacterium]
GNLLFNEEELDAIYDGSEETLSKYFANPYAIVNNGKVYTPKWILTHESEDFEREGITQEMIAEKRMQWESEDLFSYHIGKPNENAPYNYYASVDANMVTTNFDMKWDPECDEFFKEFIEFEDIAVSLVGKDEYASWLEKFKSGGRDMSEYNIITFIREYQIDRFDFNKAAKGIKSLKLERKNILYHADYDYSLTKLANPYALQHDGKIYTLKWLSKHSAEDYSNEGLPLEEVKAYLERVESVFANIDFPQDEHNLGFVQASKNTAEYELLTQGESLK